MGGNEIKEVNTMMYLGHFISNSLRDDKDILRQYRQLYAPSNMLVRTFSSCTHNVKILRIKVYSSTLVELHCRKYSKIAYACSV